MDEIRAQDLKVLEEQLQSLHLEVCTLRDSNHESQCMLENEIMLKVGAQEQIIELQAQLATHKEQVGSEQFYKEQALSSLISCELRLNSSITEILESQKTIDDLYQSMLKLRVNCCDSSFPSSSDSPNAAELSFPKAGTLKEKIEFLGNFSKVTAVLLQERACCVQLELTAAEQNLQCLQCQRDEIVDGLSRWESTCIFLEEDYRQQIARLEDRLVSSEARVGISECHAQTLKQTQKMLQLQVETLNDDLEDLKHQLEDNRSQKNDLLSQVNHLQMCLCKPEM